MPSALREVAALFLRLGFTAFGGPAAHVGLIEHEVVHRRKWIDRQYFLDLVAAVNFIPGPNSTELAIHLGLIRAGFPGLLAAGICFITPAVLIILPLAWIYVTYGSLPRVQQAMGGVNAAVVAILAAALWRFARTSIKDGFTGALLALSTAAALLLHRRPGLQPEIVILAVAALAGALWYARPKLPATALLSLPPVFLLSAAPPLASNLARMALFFLKVGATMFGSGYVLVSYLQTGLVDQHHWLTQQQLLDAIAVGQFTPGPLLTTATFIGFLLGHQQFAGGLPGGITGAILATVGIFAPSFLFVALLGPFLQKIRQNKLARGALDAMNAAVVGLLIVVTWCLARGDTMRSGAIHDLPTALVAAGTLAALLIWHINTTWLILAGAIAGVAASRGVG